MSRLGYRAAGSLSRFEVAVLIGLSVTGHAALAMKLSRARPPAPAPVSQTVEIQVEQPPVQPPIVPPQVEKPPPPTRHVTARPVLRDEPSPPPSEAPVPVAAEDVGPLPEGDEGLPVAKPVVSATPAAIVAVAPVIAAHEGAANYLKNPRPAYPEEALQEGWQGEVLLRVRVSPEGRAIAISVLRSSGQHVLDDAAIGGVRGWTFVPARQGDVPLAGWVSVPIVFRLQPGE